MVLTVKHSCSQCDSTYKVIFKEEETEDNPRFCPFCSDFIIEDETEQDEDDY